MLSEISKRRLFAALAALTFASVTIEQSRVTVFPRARSQNADAGAPVEGSGPGSGPGETAPGETAPAIGTPRAAGGPSGDAAAPYQTTVTGLRLPRPLPDLPGTVTVIPRAEIDRTPALGADDLVRLAPAAATFRRTPSLVADPTSQGLNLRGVGPSGVSRALILLDGVPVNDPFGGWVYWRALPRLSIDRIEIAPGGTSALYGNYALGGVVQLFSRPLDRRLEADIAVGSLGTRSLAVAAAERRGPFAGAIELEGFSSDGYVPVAPEQRGAIDRPANSRHGVVNGRVEAAVGAATRVGAQVRLFDERQNGGTTFTTARVRTADYGLSLQHDFARGGGLAVAAFGGVERFSQQRARIAPGRVSEALSAEQAVPSTAQGASATWTSHPLLAGGRHVLLTGVDVRRVEGTADETIHPPAPMPTSLVSRRSGGQQVFVGAFAQDAYEPTPWLELALAARADVWRNVDGQVTRRTNDGGEESVTFADRTATELSPRLGVLVRPTATTRVRGTVYRAFRAPTLNELYRPFQVGTVLTAANEALRAERLLGADLGGEKLFGAGAIRLTGFWTVLQDPIINATLAMPAAGGPARQRQNLGSARIRGLELSADVRLFRGVILLGAYTLADAVITSADSQPELVGKRLPQDPRHRGRLALSLAHRRWGQLSVQGRAQSGQFEDDLNMLPMDGFVSLDAFAASPTYWGLSLFVSAQNLLNQRAVVGRAGVDTIGPPFMAMVGLRVR